MNNHNELTCDQVHDLLPDFAGGELPAADLAALQRHTASCSACAGEVRSWRRATELVAHAASDRPTLPARTLVRPRTHIRFPRALAIAAGVLLAFGLGLYVGRAFKRPEPVVPTASLDDSLVNRMRHAAAGSPQASPLGLALLGMARRQ